MSNLVHFQGNSIPTFVDEEGNIFVAIRPIAESIGIDFGKSLKNIKEHGILSEAYQTQKMPDASGRKQEMATLPLFLLSGWLFSISANRVSEQARPMLLEYQRKCFEVLYQHFFGDMILRNKNREKMQKIMDLHERSLALQKELKDVSVYQEWTDVNKEMKKLQKEIIGQKGLKF